MGGWLQFGKGELGWERRRRNRGGESRQSVDILAFTDGITYGHIPSVYLLVILTVNGSHQSYVGIHVGNSDGEWVMSMYGDPGLNFSVILSVKSFEKIPHHHTVLSF